MIWLGLSSVMNQNNKKIETMTQQEYEEACTRADEITNKYKWEDEWAENDIIEYNQLAWDIQCYEYKNKRRQDGK